MKNLRVLVTSAAILAVLSGTAWTQTSVRVTSVQAVSGQPSIRAWFNVKCNGEAYYQLKQEQIQVLDNGMPASDVKLLMTPSYGRTPFGCTMVLDHSGSMSGGPLDSAKAAARAFVGFMDSTDEAGLIIFDNTVLAVIDLMTSDKGQLYQAINSIGVGGATAVYDAAYAGVQECATSGNSTRSVLLLTDGGDNSSSRAPHDAIALAQRNNIRIFVIGLGAAVNRPILDSMATSTGGMYFDAPSATDLSLIFSTIASFMSRRYEEYMCMFTTPDAARQQHTITLTVRSCDSVVTGSATRVLYGLATAVEPATVPSHSLITMETVTPNPVSHGTALAHFTVRADAHALPVELRLYDLLGREVTGVVRTTASAGAQALPLDVSRLAAGTYLVQLRAGNEILASRLVISR